MNERILELLKQASKLANTDDNKDIDRNFDMIVAEKFAKLIVRECMAKVCEELDNSYSEDGKEILNERVLEHFGVKE